MNEKRKTYIVGAVISLGIYLVCSFLGAFVNVLISLASGYSHFSDFKSGDNYSGLILFVVFTLVNHTFFAWLTVKLVSKYARKQGHLSNIVFIISAAIILAFFL